jgi:hypothetical protein
MAGYVIDIWKDDELVQSIAGKWMQISAPSGQSGTHKCGR